MSRKNEVNLVTRGFDDLLENFDDIENAIVDNADEILRDAAEIFLEAAEEKVPVDSGNLKESLDIKKLELKKDKIRIGIGPVGEDVFYWFFVEFGAPANNQPPQPFLRPAYEENKKQARAEIAAKLKALVERQGE